MSDALKNQLSKGILLVAEPFMLDPNFRRGVILLCDHQNDGSFGFILNKPIEMNINDLLSSFPDFESEVYYGGPVQTDTIHYLHTKGDLLPNSIEVLQGIWWGGDFEVLKKEVSDGKIKQEDIRFFVGYSGWSEGQLDEEQQYPSWLTATASHEFIFTDDWKNLWRDVLHQEGGRYAIIGSMPLPNLN